MSAIEALSEVPSERRREYGMEAPMPTEVVIVSGARTPIGRLGGAFRDMRGSDLGAIAIRAAVDRAGIPAEQVDEVIMGNVLQAAESGYSARRAMLKGRSGCRRPTQYRVNTSSLLAKQFAANLDSRIAVFVA